MKQSINRYKLVYMDSHDTPRERLIDADSYFFDEGFCIFAKRNEEIGGQPVFAMAYDYVYSVELANDLDDIINKPVE